MIRVTAIVWKDASSIASGSLDRLIVLWDINKRTQTRVFKGHSKGVSSLCFINDTKTLVSTGIDQNVRVWNATYRGTAEKSQQPHDDRA